MQRAFETSSEVAFHLNIALGTIDILKKYVAPRIHEELL